MIRIGSAILAASGVMLTRLKGIFRIASIVAVAGVYLNASWAANNEYLIVQNDRGGSVRERVELIETYRTRGTRIHIRGRFCLSACTLYLGLDGTCVAPDTIFGFHGPSSQFYGFALPFQSFDYWSRLMADHYPEPLRTWFIENGRHRIVGFHEFSGQSLIEMGIAQCPRGAHSRTG